MHDITEQRLRLELTDSVDAKLLKMKLNILTEVNFMSNKKY